ncbi:hypothetical protein [Micrococcus luteus]
MFPLLTDAVPPAAASPWEFGWDAIGALGEDPTLLDSQKPRRRRHRS